MFPRVLAIIMLAFVASSALGASDRGSLNRVAADALLAIDQHRATVIDRIVTQWGEPLAQSGAGLNVEQLRAMLAGLRADHLLAASLAGTLDGLRNVLATAVIATTPLREALMQTKALGDSADDVVYTPVTPCRLVETRGTFAAVYQGGGAFSGGEVRTYTIQGGNGVCLSQLPAGLNPSAVQLQVFGIPISSGSSGDIEILPQGSAFGSTATEVYVGNVTFNTVSTTVKINLANNQIGVQVRGGGANVAIDVVGYFKAPNGAGNYFVQGGNAFGTTASMGTYDNNVLEIKVNNQRAIRFEPNATSPNVVGGHPNNSASGSYAQTVGGGGTADSNCFDPLSLTFTRSCSNHALTAYATVGGGLGNSASGGSATVAGGHSNIANSLESNVAGGYGNVASANFAAVAGGYENTASGQASIVAGGSNNIAGGFATVAMGYRAQVFSNGSFVFSDSTSADFYSGTNNEFIVGATGGIGMYTAKNYSTGCHINGGGGSWICSSSRDVKRDFEAVDVAEVLRRVAQLPMQKWRFMNEDPAIRHLGPMAQDFRAAFELGTDDRTIATVDENGVALAAIQGLHQLAQEKDARIAELERRIAQLERAVEVLAAKQ